MCQMKQWFRVEVGAKLCRLLLCRCTSEAWQEHRYKRRICNRVSVSGAAIIIEATGTNVIEPAGRQN